MQNKTMDKNKKMEIARIPKLLAPHPTGRAARAAGLVRLRRRRGGQGAGICVVQPAAASCAAVDADGALDGREAVLAAVSAFVRGLARLRALGGVP